jgi:hypothetical protein
MRKLMIGAAALLAVCVAAPAASAATGYVDASYARARVDVGAGAPKNDIDLAGVGGVVAFDANALGVQLDGSYANANADGGDANIASVGAHVYKRTNQWLAGGYAGYANVDPDNGDSVAEWTVAAEGQYYMTRTTLGAALVYSNSNDANVDTWTLEGDAKHFYTDNFSVSANLALGKANPDVGGDSNLWAAGLGAEYQFAGAPVSVFGGYQHAEFDNDGGDIDTFGIGARWNFGSSLIERNRSGGDLRRHGGAVGRLFGV